MQPCVTFNKIQTIENWYKQKVYKLKKVYNSKIEAIKAALDKDKLPIGLFWQEQELAYHQQDLVLKKETLVEKKINRIDIKKLITEFI